MTEHYFSANPLSATRNHRINTNLGGKNVEVCTASGVFSTSGIDRGTAVLLNSIAAKKITGNILDIGCGWGAIAIDAALRSPEASVWALDVNERALEVAQTNAQALGLRNIKCVRAEQIPDDIKFTEIRSNPPIRVGKKVLHELLSTWLPRLEIGGEAFLVVAKKLGANSLFKWLTDNFNNYEVELHTRDKGFHVICVKRLDI